MLSGPSTDTREDSAPAQQPAPAPAFRARVVAHGPDYRSVRWGSDPDGTPRVYHLTSMQAAVVKILWEAWENCTPDVGGEYLLEACGSDRDGGRIDTVFVKHPAWGALVVRGKTRATYRLADPE